MTQSLPSPSKVVEAVEEADNRYNEGWPRSKVVEFLQENYILNEQEALQLAMAVENIRYGAGRRATRKM